MYLFDMFLHPGLRQAVVWAISMYIVCLVTSPSFTCRASIWASASVIFLGAVAGGNLGAGVIVGIGSGACAKA